MNQPESKNGNHEVVVIPEDTEPPAAHRHYLRDRKNRKRVEEIEAPKLPSHIPISDSDRIELTLTEELDVWHLIVRLPLLKWVGKFEQQLCKVQLDELPLLVAIRNGDGEQYLSITLQLDVAQVTEYVDVWGKVYWVGKTQLNSKVVKQTTKRVSDSPISAVKIKVLDVESDILVDLFLSRKGKEAHEYQGLINQGNTCYMNSYLQMLFHIDCLRHMVFQIGGTMPGKFPATLQNVFYRLAHDSKPVSTEQLSKSYGWSKKEAWVQQDIQEFSCLFFEVLQKKINEQPELNGSFNSLFEGELMHYVECIDVDYKSESVERFIDLQLSVQGTGNLLESLNHYTGYELLDGDNMYFTEHFGKQRARKGIVISKLPPVLMIQLKRFEYNPYTEKNDKILSRYEYPQMFDFSPVLHKPTPLYRLYAVLVHQGEKASSGHYYAYLRMHDGKWYKFNDEIVKEATQKQVFEYNFGGQLKVQELDAKELVLMEKTVPVNSTAYMLVYCNTEDEARIFEKNDFIPQWLKEENEAKIEEERQKKLKQEMVEISLTDWAMIVATPATSCGFLKQVDTSYPDYRYDRFVPQEVPKDALFDEYAESLRKAYLASDEQISFWLLQEAADKELLLNPYSRKESPTMHELFREHANTSLIVLTKASSVIRYDELTRNYVLGQAESQNSAQQTEGEFELEAYKQNQLYVMVVKLYQMDANGDRTFTFDNYFLLKKEFSYGTVSGMLRSLYEQFNFTCQYFLEGKGHYSVANIDESSFEGIDSSKSRLIRVIVEKLASDSDRPLMTLSEYLTTEQNKICVRIRSEDGITESDLFLDKNMDIQDLRRYIFDNLCAEVDIESPEYMLIRCRTAKNSKALNEVFSGNLEQLTRFEKIVVFGKSPIKIVERESNSIIMLVYRYRTMSRSAGMSTKISKDTTAQSLLALIDELSLFKECLEQEMARKMRLVLLDNLEEKVLRIISSDSEIVPTLSKVKCHMYVEADEEAAQQDFTVFCHHKTKTGECLPNPFVVRCPQQITQAELRQLLVDSCKEIQYAFDGKQHKLQAGRLRIKVYQKGTSASRGTQLLQTSTDALTTLFAAGSEISAEITHMAVSKQIQSMKLNV